MRAQSVEIAFSNLIPDVMSVAFEMRSPRSLVITDEIARAKAQTVTFPEERIYDILSGAFDRTIDDLLGDAVQGVAQASDSRKIRMI